MMRVFETDAGSAMPGNRGVAYARLGAVTGIGLLHLLLLYAFLLRSPAPRDEDGSEAPRTMTVLLVPRVIPPSPPTATVAAPRKVARAIVKREAETPEAAAVHLAPDPVPEALQPEPPVAPQGRRFDMLALREAARQVERERVPTPLERLRESEQLRSMDDSDAARAIRKAERPDCKTAYGGGSKANLLMLVPLVLDTITDKGCKW